MCVCGTLLKEQSVLMKWHFVIRQTGFSQLWTVSVQGMCSFKPNSGLKTYTFSLWKTIYFLFLFLYSCRWLSLRYPVTEMNVLRHFISDSSPTFYVVVLHKRFFWKKMCIIVQKPDLSSNQIRCSDAAAQFIHDQLSGDWGKGGGGIIVQRQLPTYDFSPYLLV